MKCPFCGAENSTEARFCLHCGNKLSGFDKQEAGSFATFECPFCHAQVKADSHFCPRCGKNVNAKGNYSPVTDQEDVIRCPACNELLTAEEKKCHNCGKKLSYMDKQTPKARKEFYQLLYTGLGLTLSGIIPIVGLVFSVLGVVFSAKTKDKSRASKDAFVLSIIGISIALFLQVFNLVTQLQSLL